MWADRFPVPEEFNSIGGGDGPGSPECRETRASGGHTPIEQVSGGFSGFRLFLLDPQLEVKDVSGDKRSIAAMHFPVSPVELHRRDDR